MNSAKQTTIAQGRRLLAVGCPAVKLRMDGHHVVPEPIALGRLWDIAHGIGLKREFPTGLTSNKRLEALVTAIEEYYVEEQCCSAM